MSFDRENPESVAGHLLAALRHNDRPHPDAGVELLFTFTTERMRSATGDLAALKRALHSPRYAPLLNHVACERGALERLGAAARQSVTVTSPHGEPGTFLLALVRGEQGWRLSGLAREGIFD